jgi:hypothetical protein
VLWGAAAGVLLAALIVVGSRGFATFDPALIGYAVAAVVATAATVFRYAFWLQKPPTGRYFRRGWELFLNPGHLRRHLPLVPSAIWHTLLAQTFIRPRGLRRWVMHLCIFWGVILSLLITLPLAFGWLRFTLSSLQPPVYLTWIFGFPTFSFHLGTVFAFVFFHALDGTALLLLVGLGLAFGRRFREVGLLTVQRFEHDLAPLFLLSAVALSGLALTADSLWLRGRFYWYLSLTHESVVVLWMISLPFTKFFHVIERPATVGIELYRGIYVGDPGRGQAHRCPGCGQVFAAEQFVRDLKATLRDLGQDYRLASGEHGPRLQDYCPSCKRVARARAFFRQMAPDGNRFL